ncbi:CrcB family protein [Agrococcus sp. SL85]|uniref:CrcB family protein n=1 Tax=Agrococcus sp. SL85 TaxID=2995141 RepID=UPI00226C99E3|nr:CrcB family protein [Agrococcus sp. SL85]WAC67292.1 CrcB family protein [Agrococcus sp. SL85]
MPLVASALAVLVGGMLGTAARAALDAAIADWWSLLLINVSGSLLLGASTAALAAAPAWLRHGVGAGVLGGFTTFSAVAIASVAAGASSGGVAMLVPALPGIAIALGQLAACLAAAWAGLTLGRRIARARAGVAP